MFACDTCLVCMTHLVRYCFCTGVGKAGFFRDVRQRCLYIVQQTYRDCKVVHWHIDHAFLPERGAVTHSDIPIGDTCNKQE